MKTTELIRERLKAHGNKHQLIIDWENFDEILAEAKTLECENIAMA